MTAVAAVVFIVVLAAMLVVHARVMAKRNAELLAKLETLRAETLEAFEHAQQADTARVIAETRAAIAKMNAVADGLWSGLHNTVM